MALGSVRKRTHTWVSGGERKTSTKWEARYRIPGTNRQPAKSFDLKKDAETWLVEQTSGLARGVHVDPRNHKMTVREYAATWEAVQVCSPGTAKLTDNALRLHILPALGDRAIGSLKRSDIQGFVKRLSATVTRKATPERPERLMAPKNVTNIYAKLAQMLEAAVDDQVIPRSPCRKITLPTDHDDRVVIPEVAEIHAVLEALPERYRVVISLLVGSGLRIGEALGLKVSAINFLKREISVTEQRLQSGRLDDLKTKGSRRVIPIGKVTTDALALHLKTFGAASDGSLISDEAGRPVYYEAWRRVLKPATAATGVELGSHGCRHFAASALISGGASVKQVQEFLGHSDPMTTLRTYAHLWPGDEDRTRAVLDAALSSVTQPEPAHDEIAERRG